MENTAHPSTYINADDMNIIRHTAAEAEQTGMLHPQQLEIAYRQKWFKLLVPQAYSGRQITLPNLVRLQEAISWADGSMGWVVTLCSGAGWFGGFIDPEMAKKVFNSDTVCLAGSGAHCGTADITANGYRINGTWNYASGARHATHFTCNCIIKKDGEVVLDHEKNPLILPFIIDKKDVALLPTWKYIGMVATGSHSFTIQDVEVSEDRSFHIDANYAEIDSALYQYPFLQLAEATLAVNLSGIAMHFTDLCRDIFEKKQSQPKLTGVHKILLNQVFVEQTDKLQLARNNFFTAVDESWIGPLNNRGNKLLAVSKTSLKLARQAQETVNILYPYCGLMAASPDTEINRVWRDLHTASQHSLLTFAND